MTSIFGCDSRRSPTHCLSHSVPRMEATRNLGRRMSSDRVVEVKIRMLGWWSIQGDWVHREPIHQYW